MNGRGRKIPAINVSIPDKKSNTPNDIDKVPTLSTLYP